ncbi:ACLY synthase, partial [Atractosteus spatula]|nr:ACLY synthase [Atractosteus spatula]
MSAKAISEQTGKEFLYKYICTSAAVQNRFKYANVTAETDWGRLAQDHPWLLTERLVVKPDQLIKRRGKLGLVGVNLDLQGVKEWLKPRLNVETTCGAPCLKRQVTPRLAAYIGNQIRTRGSVRASAHSAASSDSRPFRVPKIAKAKGTLKNFLIEPFVAHKQAEEFYVCIYATREGDYVLFHHEGGVDVGDVDAKAQKYLVGVGAKLTEDAVKTHLLEHVPAAKKDVLASFVMGLFNLYEDLYFTYLEINPLVVTKDGVYVLDMAAKIDATADYLCKAKWGDVEFPPPFGREAYPEEAYIADLDAKSGASLKLTLLNPRGRIWTMVAGGGASVVYSDTICDLGGVNELANYGEYSGAPSEQQTYDYAKTILSLMTREKHNEGKVLIIGGSIANFTNVAATFKGIVRAIKDYQVPLKEHEVTIFVRRGGPNYQEGLRVMGEVGKTTGIPIHVFGTETHMTAIVGMALGHRPIPNQPPTAAHTANFLLNSSGSASVECLCDKAWPRVLCWKSQGTGCSVIQVMLYCPIGENCFTAHSQHNTMPHKNVLTEKSVQQCYSKFKGKDTVSVVSAEGCLITPATSRTASFSEPKAAHEPTPAKKAKPGVPPAPSYRTPYVPDGTLEGGGKNSALLTTHLNIFVELILTEQQGSAGGVGVTLFPEVKLNKPDIPSVAFCPSGHHQWFAVDLSNEVRQPSRQENSKASTLFTKHTKAIVWGMQTRAVQGMLDFDYICSREEPSVAALVYPFTGDHKQKFYWGHKEILIPVYKNMSDAMRKHPEVDVLISFASLRSAFDSTMETMQYPQIHTIAIIAEGIPEAQTRKLIKTADEKGVTIIGPATVGGIKPGCFKIGNTGGMLDNILASKLYRPGSVAYVSRSGGMSNELNNIISRGTDGVFEGVAIGGDRYPGSTFMDHVLRYQDTPGVKMIVVLGEIGGTEEYKICQGIKEGRITKPVVCWCIGTCATMFSSEVQFGHAGACANQASETAVAKNQALREAGAIVPKSFDELGDAIKSVYDDLVAKGVIVPAQEVPPPTVPMDYSWARELGLIRKPASFMTSICDERGQELIYAGMPITEVFKEEMGIGGVLGLLWFQRRLPRYACQFIEMCLMVTADHGPAVSGAHNTIVCARAGKDLISSLTSGLLTIGDRFGGALDAAAKQFSKAFDSSLLPMEFVNKMKKEGKLIMGIGHRVKSINNPDMRVQILKDFVKQHFPATHLLDYALDVEKITTSKACAAFGLKPNLILNVDGFIGVAFVDLLRTCDGFTREEADEYVEIGALNGIFVLGRSMGFIGHYLDQKRLKQGLYRHPWDDISYVLPEHMTM